MASCAVGVTSRAAVSVVEPPRVALGVGSDEDAVALVGGSDVGSSYADPLRVIPDSGQVSEYTSESPENRSPCGVSHTSRVGFHEAKGVG
jgi:hypothetical protein